MTIALLILIGLLSAAATALMIVSLHRRNDLLALAAMTLMIIAAIPATAYASITS